MHNVGCFNGSGRRRMIAADSVSSGDQPWFSRSSWGKIPSSIIPRISYEVIWECCFMLKTPTQLNFDRFGFDYWMLGIWFIPFTPHKPCRPSGPNRPTPYPSVWDFSTQCWFPDPTLGGSCVRIQSNNSKNAISGKTFYRNFKKSAFLFFRIYCSDSQSEGSDCESEQSEQVMK